MTRVKKGKRGDMPHTIAKRYRMTEKAVLMIKKSAPPHGSQARALQIATELLVRMKKPIKVSEQFAKSEVIGMTYKLTPRTIKLIDDLTEQYGKRGNVLDACAQILSEQDT
jgi:hypothetical protein